MARKKQSEKVENVEQVKLSNKDILNLGKDVGLTLMRDNTYANVYNWLPTGIPQYDSIMGGGIPFGRITEVFGKKASGKSTFALALSKVASDLDVITVWIDVEGTSDINRLEQLGINTEKVFAIQPEFNKTTNMIEPLTVELIGEKIEKLLKTFRDNSPDTPLLIIWDSIAATSSKVEMESDYDSERPGLKAKSLAKFFNKVTPLINGYNVALVAINQARDVMGGSFGYGDNIDSPGGKALEHVVSLQLLVNKVDASKFNQKKYNSTSAHGSYVGHNMQVTTKKSKVSRPEQKAKAFVASEYELADGTEVNGFNTPVNMYFAAVNNGIFKTGGSYKKFTDSKGQEHSKYEKDWLLTFYNDTEPELIREIIAQTYYKLFPKGYPAFDNSLVGIDNLIGMNELRELYNNKDNNTTEEVGEGETQAE
ncbi:DNA repair recombination protein [Mammaliicoccus virus vB_MscM-PMS2]|nr:DNA repair recombination protein [Mammaliicoccus virus vB_MscM-PMS2]